MSYLFNPDGAPVPVVLRPGSQAGAAEARQLEKLLQEYGKQEELLVRLQHQEEELQVWAGEGCRGRSCRCGQAREGQQAGASMGRGGATGEGTDGGATGATAAAAIKLPVAGACRGW